MNSATAPAEVRLAERWGAQGFVTDLGGPVHWIRWDGPDTADPIVFVHGLGGSHLNWVTVGADLAADRAVYAPDLPGFGLSPGHPRPTSVEANAALVIRFVREVVGRPVVLIGNSMGGMISALVAQGEPDLVRGLVLVDPALPLVRGPKDRVVRARFAVLAVPRLGEFAMRQARRRLPASALVAQTVELCVADPSRAPREPFEATVELLGLRAQSEGDAIEASFALAGRSLMVRLGRARRCWRALGEIDAPVLLVHGSADRLVSVRSARAAAARYPSWTYVEMPGVGHTPMLEVPEDFLAAVRPWLAALDGRATPPRADGTGPRSADPSPASS